MKQNKVPKLYEAIGDMPDAYLDEASNEKKSPKRARLIALVAATLAILLLVPTVALFSYFSDPLRVSKDHPYFAVIEAIREKNEESAYIAKLERGGVIDRLKDLFLAKGEDTAPNATGREDGVSGSASIQSPGADINDNQVAGVLEADIVKRADDTLVYLNGGVLHFYSIDGENSREITRVLLADLAAFDGFAAREMYYADGKLLIETVGYRDGVLSTRLVSLSLFDCLALKKDLTPSVVTLDGMLLSTRYTEGKLLVMTHFASDDEIDPDDEGYLPHYSDKDGVVAISPDHITVPTLPSGANYTVAYLLSADTLDVIDHHALFGMPSAQYVSDDTLYLVSESTALIKDGGDTKVFDVSENQKRACLKSTAYSYIEAIRYADGALSVEGGVTLEGSVKDQYSLDERNGILRVAVTNRDTEYVLDDDHSRIEFRMTVENASLYLVSLSDFTLISRAYRFAPIGESVQSARFDGDIAYICTAEIITMTDPVYRFNLSDPKTISSLDTGTIDGYSTSLVQLSGGDLLGIGYGDDPTTLKLEIYRKKETSLVSVTSYEIPYCEFSENYKSYYINREDNCFGIAIYRHREVEDGVSYYPNTLTYYLFSYDGEALTVKATVELGNRHANIESVRGFVEEAYLYVVYANGLKVKPLLQNEPR